MAEVVSQPGPAPGAEPARGGRRALWAAAALLLLGADDGSGPDPAEELRRLERTGLSLAWSGLERSEASSPFAFVLRSDGRTQRISPRKKKRRRRGDESPTEELVRGLRERARNGEYRAVAVFRFVVISLGRDAESHAVHVGLEHASGLCREAFVPYRERKEGAPEVQPALQRPRAAQVFQRCEADPGS